MFANPLSPDEAIGNVSALLDRPHVRTLSEDAGFWEVYRDVVGETPARGNLVPDAHLAALAIEHGATLYTTDRDFTRFPGLKFENPLGA